MSEQRSHLLIPDSGIPSVTQTQGLVSKRDRETGSCGQTSIVKFGPSECWPQTFPISLVRLRSRASPFSKNLLFSHRFSSLLSVSGLDLWKQGLSVAVRYKAGGSLGLWAEVTSSEGVYLWVLTVDPLQDVASWSPLGLHEMKKHQLGEREGSTNRNFQKKKRNVKNTCCKHTNNVGCGKSWKIFEICTDLETCCLYPEYPYTYVS